MPIVLVCPNGHKSFVKDEHAGKMAACPICRAVVVVPDPRLTPGPAASPLPAIPPPVSPPPIGFVPSADDEPVTVEPIAPSGTQEARKKGGRRQALARVNRGLSLHYVKMILYLVSLLLLMVWIMLQAVPTRRAQAAAPPGTEPGTWSILAIAVMVLGCLLVASEIVTPLVGMAGSVWCAWVPTKSRARVLILASILLDFFSLLLMVASLVVLFTLRPTETLGPFLLVGFVLGVVRGLLWLASWILFMLFLKQLAAYLDQDAAEDEAWRLLLKGLLLLVTLPVSGLLVVIPGLLCCGYAAYVGGVSCWFVIAVNYLFEILSLIGDLRKATQPARGS